MDAAPTAAAIAVRSPRQSAVEALLAGVGAEAVGLLSLGLSFLIIEALCGSDCGMGVYALVIFVGMPLVLIGTAAGAGLVAALLARRMGRPVMKAGLLVAVGTAVALPAMFGGLFLMESFKPLLFALPFFAGFAAYLTGLLWSNWRQSHSLT